MKIILGPRTANVSKEAAEKALTENPAFPKGAEFAVEEMNGRWVAAYSEKTAAEGPPFDEGDSGDGLPSPDGPPADDTDDSAPKDDSPKDDSDSSDKKDGEGDKGDPIAHLTELVTKLMDALGLSDGPGDSPVPGMDEGMPGEGAPEHHAPHQDGDTDTNPNEPGNQLSDGKTHTVHERALKPGESPPGTTPVGAPSFASTHPWARTAAEKRSFKVSEVVDPDTQVKDIYPELQALASEVDCSVDQIFFSNSEGQRWAHALIVKA